MKRGGSASKHQIAQELKISSDYASLILSELKRKGEVAFSGGFYVLTPAKKDVRQGKEQKKPSARSKKSKGTKKAKKPRVKKHAPHPLTSVLGINDSLARILERAGYGTVESLAEAPINKLMDAAKLKLNIAAKLINQARKTK